MQSLPLTLKNYTNLNFRFKHWHLNASFTAVDGMENICILWHLQPVCSLTYINDLSSTKVYIKINRLKSVKFSLLLTAALIVFTAIYCFPLQILLNVMFYAFFGQHTKNNIVILRMLLLILA